MKRILLIALSASLVCCTIMAEVKPFRFAQLTDIHLNPNGDGPTKALLASIDQINRTDSIDFVLVTGEANRVAQAIAASSGRNTTVSHTMAFVS